eukprot:GHVT01050907.1.p1 GENE.GHVT01050907.1~~GHVT01050907.1.p1  ORF type:complete len:125 (+),score=16.22 GHVT01050907.1:160-534(+)
MFVRILMDASDFVCDFEVCTRRQRRLQANVLCFSVKTGDALNWRKYRHGVSADRIRKVCVLVLHRAHSQDLLQSPVERHGATGGKVHVFNDTTLIVRENGSIGHVAQAPKSHVLLGGVVKYPRA